MSAAYCSRFSAGVALKPGMISPTSRPRKRWMRPIHSASRTGEVVVDGDEMHALAAEAVEVGGQRRHEGLALTGLHLGDPAEVQRRAAHQLDVEVALADDPGRRLAHDGEGLDQQVVELDPVLEALAELSRLRPQLVVGQLLELGLEGVDLGDHRLEGLELLAFAGAEDAVEDAHAGFEPTGYPPGAERPGDARRGLRPKWFIPRTRRCSSGGSARAGGRRTCRRTPCSPSLPAPARRGRRTDCISAS